MSEIVFTKWHISDYDGRRSGEPRIIGGENVFHCKRLSAWKRVKGYLFRWDELLFFLNIKIDRKIRYSYLLADWETIVVELNNKLKDRNLIIVLSEMQEKFNDYEYVLSFYKYKQK